MHTYFVLLWVVIVTLPYKVKFGTDEFIDQVPVVGYIQPARDSRGPGLSSHPPPCRVHGPGQAIHTHTHTHTHVCASVTLKYSFVPA